ncbi:hypothetical protein POM88_032481 [Heracleum sosnowskyi]|uniref:Uncharacterized protein n=1 Tax=Heracleum sosnowskyi TaxID=360622 RepID=A0AAD8I1N0_9APIA|nr:hypothetical protein POM88_032481 [Heracleum sosnowskyi]
MRHQKPTNVFYQEVESTLESSAMSGFQLASAAGPLCDEPMWGLAFVVEEGSPLMVHACLPVTESFGFADELRRWTSGASIALLVLSHWEALLEDPFFVPKTEKEKEEFGDGAGIPNNTARKQIDGVRR